jgi:hypothetical protein
MSGMQLNTRNKLEEARFFLNKIQETLTDSKISYFYLSAFLASWRSIPDVLLYDLAQLYGIINYFEKIERSTSFRAKRNKDSFRFAAKELRNSEALEFLAWWTRKMRQICDLELSNRRIEAVHEGLSPYPIIVSPFATPTTFDLAGFVRYQKYKADMGDIIGKCRDGLALMEDVVNEAERKFRVNLQ